MTYPPKVISVNGLDVTVATADEPNDVPAVRLTATIGDVVTSKTHTLGAVDGALDVPTVEQVQTFLDRARFAIAKVAAQRYLLRQHLESIT